MRSSDRLYDAVNSAPPREHHSLEHAACQNHPT